MEKLQVAATERFGFLRGVYDSKTGEVWLIGKDVAYALGYKDTDQAIRKHVDPEDKLPRRFDGSGQEREAIFINESGVYALIFGSKLPTAKAFKHWVTSEVLPSIRKEGYYIDRSALKLELTEELLSGYDELHKDKAKLLKQDLLQSLKDQIKVLRAENKKLRRVLQASEERAADLEGKVNDVQCNLLEQVINLREGGDGK